MDIPLRVLVFAILALVVLVIIIIAVGGFSSQGNNALSGFFEWMTGFFGGFQTLGTGAGNPGIN